MAWLSIPVGFPVFSWDNLSTKGALHVAPDSVFAWNEVQRRELVALHGLDPSCVKITGAPRFGEFFERQPSERVGALPSPTESSSAADHLEEDVEALVLAAGWPVSRRYEIKPNIKRTD